MRADSSTFASADVPTVFVVQSLDVVRVRENATVASLRLVVRQLLRRAQISENLTNVKCQCNQTRLSGVRVVVVCSGTLSVCVLIQSVIVRRSQYPKDVTR